jgi:putative addiction module component (TIGR02574 family)
MTIEQILQATKSLSPQDRIDLASRILDEADPITPDPETIAELERRWEEHLADPSSAIDAELIFKEAMERIDLDA